MMPIYRLSQPETAGNPFLLATRPDARTEATTLRGKRAVIVEDEGITQLQLKKMLLSHGIQVVGTASNGKEGVDFVLKERPDFVLMDIRMPVMNGLEAIERILAEYSVCIVMLTAYSGEDYRQRAQALGASGYVLKPVIAETLLPQLKAAYYHYNHPDLGERGGM